MTELKDGRGRAWGDALHSRLQEPPHHTGEAPEATGRREVGSVRCQTPDTHQTSATPLGSDDINSLQGGQGDRPGITVCLGGCLTAHGISLKVPARVLFLYRIN